MTSTARPLRIVRAGRMDYSSAWELQRQVHAERVAGRVADTVLLVEHDPVFTAGRRTSRFERPLDGTPVIDVDRGGKITWHGPGQLVGYPVILLDSPVDVVAYVRDLEAALVATCAEVGVPAVRVEGRSGVWVAQDERGPDRKLAAIGVRVARGVTMHGFALNCDCDLAQFGRIVPCGIVDAGVTSLSAELRRPVTIHDVEESVVRKLATVFGAEPVTVADLDRDAVAARA